MTRARDCDREAGFTLVEVLVSVLIFAVAAGLGTGLLTTSLRAKALQEAALEEAQAVERVRALLREDLGQLVMRPARRADGSAQPYVFAGDADGADPLSLARSGQARDILVLTRRGWANPGAARPRSTLQRVAWRLDGDTLQRVAWAYPDLARASEARALEVLQGVSAVELEFLLGGTWRSDAFIAPSGDEERPSLPPRAVRLSYVLDGVGPVEHLVLTPASEQGR